MIGNEHRPSGVYLAGGRSAEMDLVSDWAEKQNRPVVHLSAEFAVEREVDAGAALVAVDAAGGALDAIAQTARIRATRNSVPLLVLGPQGEQCDPFRQVAVRCGADIVLGRPVLRSSILEALDQLTKRRVAADLASETEIQLTASCSLNLDGKCLRVGQAELALSKGKFELLLYMLKHAGHAVTADELIRAGVLTRGQRSRYRAIVLELREKLGDARRLIRTVPGYGYRFDASNDLGSQRTHAMEPRRLARFHDVVWRRAQ